MGAVNQIVRGISDAANSVIPGSGAIAVAVAAYYVGGVVGEWVGAAAADGLSIALADTAISGATLVSVGYGIGTAAELYVIGSAARALTGDPSANVNQNLASGLLSNTASNVAGIPVIYGTRRVGGTRVFTEVSGANNEYLNLVIALCEGEVGAISNIYIDGVVSTDPKFAGFLTATAYIGTDTQAADPTLIAAVPSEWTSAHQGKGVAYIALQLKFSTTAFSGFPTITADVQGKKVYDPRTTTTVYSNNPALCIRDYLTNARYGKGILASLIDDASIIAAANYCDALVTVPGGTQARYTCDGVIDVNNTALDNLRSLLTSCRGMLVYSGGLYKLRLDQAGTSGFAFTEDNITGNWTISQPGRRSKYNRVTAGFYNPSNNWQPDLAVADSTAYRALDNSLLLETKLDLPFTVDKYRATQLAGLALKQSRFGILCTFTAFQDAMRCEVGDVVSITHSTPGWSGKLFRVIQMTIKDNDEIEVVAQEYDVAVYNLDTLTAVTSTPTLNLPNIFTVPTPASLTLTSGTSELLANSDGTITSRIKCVWPVPANVFATVAEIQMQLNGATSWQTVTSTDATQGAAWIWPVKDGQLYNVRIRFVNTVGVPSPFVTQSHTVVGKTAPPTDPASLFYVIETAGIRLSWPAITDVDRAGYEVRVGASWAAGTLVAKVSMNEYLMKQATAGSYVLWVKSLDTTGNYSTNAATTTAVVGVPATPTASYAVVSADEVLSWTIPASGFAIDRYEIRFGSTFGGGTFVDTTKGTGYKRRVDYAGSRSYWVAAVDTAGNYSAAGNVTSNIVAPGAVIGSRADIVDNNILIYWSAPSTGTLAVVSYEVRKGSTWAGGTVVGSNGNSTFAGVFEQQSGTYTYWIAAIDSAGSYGTPASVSAFVNQPPDYILRASINSTFSGTLSNVFLTNGTLVLPVNTTETWTQHFSNNGYATPQAQISAGNPLYINPSPTSATYTEVYDYGASLPATNIVVTLNSTLLSGTVSASCQINYSNTSSSGPWTSATAGATSALAVNFRWVQVVYTFTATAGANLLRVDGLNIKLSVKQRTDSGSGTTSASLSTVGSLTAYWSTITFGFPFISADTPIVQPNSTVPLIPVVNYAGGVNPTTFQVAFVNTAGTAIASVPFSWSVRGY